MDLSWLSDVYGPRLTGSDNLYEEAPPDDLKQASVILASFVYHAAMRDEMLPRPKLAGPGK